MIDEERQKLGRMQTPEKIVLAAGCVTAFLWVFRQPIRFGALSIPGWSSLFPQAGLLHDATVAIVMAIALCLIPVNRRGGLEWKGHWERFVMEWRSIEAGVPWGVVILFGGGFALAAGMEQSGLARWLGSFLGELKGTPLWIVFPCACLLAVGMTEMTSNVATILMISPVLGEVALEFGLNPYVLLFPATIMGSFAFMLPVATPPNAIVFSSGWITIPAMFRAGAVLDLIALAIIPAIVYVLGSAVFGLG